MTKTCNTCGATYDANGWAGLIAVGVQYIGGELQELRQCQCGSTLAIEVTLANAVDAFDRWAVDAHASWSVIGSCGHVTLTVQSVGGDYRGLVCSHYQTSAAAMAALQTAACWGPL